MPPPRVVATGDETRRRLQRDVHDSAQQRVVHIIIALKLAKEPIASGGTAAELVDEALENAQRANSELRDIVPGILPAALSRDGLRAGLESLVCDFSLPAELDSDIPRIAADAGTTAYFIVAETLTNLVKHARGHRCERETHHQRRQPRHRGPRRRRRRRRSQPRVRAYRPARPGRSEQRNPRDHQSPRR
jgi:signal transduction histidine kinase